MAYVTTESNDDLLTLNGFRIEIGGAPVAAITTVGGLNRVTGEIEWTDGGTGNVQVFSDQQKKFGPISMKYRVDPTKGEFDNLRNLVTSSMYLGVRFDFSIIKYHHGKELFRILVYRSLWNNEQFPEMDKNGSGPFEVTLQVPCAYWEIVK